MDIYLAMKNSFIVDFLIVPCFLFTSMSRITSSISATTTTSRITMFTRERLELGTAEKRRHA